MEATGVVRKLDNMGRIVFPIELRRVLEINEGDPMEIFVDGDRILFRKYERACIFYGEARGVVEHKGKNICTGCLRELKDG